MSLAHDGIAPVHAMVAIARSAESGESITLMKSLEPSDAASHLHQNFRGFGTGHLNLIRILFSPSPVRLDKLRRSVAPKGQTVNSRG